MSDLSRTKSPLLFAGRGKRTAFPCPASLQAGITLLGCLLPLVLPSTVLAQKGGSNGKQSTKSPGKRGPVQGGPKGTVQAGVKASGSGGRTLFVKNCSLCHGASGQGGEGPNLQHQTLSESAIITTVRNGVRGEMPSFGSKFKEADLKALAAFVHSLKK